MFLAIPTYNHGIDIGLSNALTHATASFRVVKMYHNASLLAHNFNVMLCSALNARKDISLTHFCLVHSDVIPVDPNWLTIMVDEMAAHKLDALSAVIPIKDGRGITSTGVDMSGTRPDDPNPWLTRRVSMTEVHKKLPDTFFASDVVRALDIKELAPENATLLVNTGLLLIDLKAPWVEQLHFTINDTIIKDDDGVFAAYTEPEDWYFSRCMRRVGARVAATKKVRIRHSGRFEYQNYAVWGAHEMDPVFKEPVQTEQIDDQAQKPESALVGG